MEIIEKVEDYVHSEIDYFREHADDHYDFWEEHIKYVYQEAIDLAKKYNADEEIVRLGALLHDIALIRCVGTKKDHHINGAKIADEVLTEFGYPDDKKERVIKCVFNHRSSKNATNLEEMCVADADILAHFDNMRMVFYHVYVTYGIPLQESKEWMSNAFEKDYNDLSEHTKKTFKKRYQEICSVILGE